MRVPVLHAVVPDRVARAPGFEKTAARMQAACGADLALHLRLRETSAVRMLELADALSAGARATGGWCVLNERLDVALAAGADAVQLGAGALPLAAARSILPPDVRLGASVHSEAEARVAMDGGADYLLLGTIYSSASHPERPPLGSGAIRSCTGAAPIVAIAQITRDTISVP
ncbi:MAG: thiamine phosphate synthase, partial [Gemmatimonadota bacterium]